MEDRKIAILVDSGTDVPGDFIREHNIFVAPLKIIFSDGEYDDRVNITPKEVYDRLEQEIPKTSLPDPGYVHGLFERIKEQGYGTVLVITISSNLSGTHNLLRVAAQEHPELDVHMVDTKNIGIGAGLQAMLAARLVREGAPLEDILAKLRESIKESRIYFCLDTLEYLAKGGRIGKVSALLGSVLHLVPVISCNPDGIYETVAKVRGNAHAVARAVSLVVAHAARHARFAVAVAYGSAQAEAMKVLAELRQLLPRCEQFIQTDVSPALGVHTGPGLIGIAIQALPA
ncbi:MAG TPA: DegV family protein [Candidatus Limnocylindria bacterium]|nr:DegV family protein [Candidatus Limnocylindria bacterium]